MCNLTLMLQVEVIVGKIPCSCQSENCSFAFIRDMAPEIFSFTPSEGQGGTEIVINGIGFGNDQNRVSVTIGSAECTITTFNDSTIVCMALNHAAGSYILQVHVEGIGNANRAEDVPCFTYLLSITSISPTTGGIGTGYLLNISGEGFLDFKPISPGSRRKMNYHLPLFNLELGVPDIELEHFLNLCPTTHWRFLHQLHFIAACLSEKAELTGIKFDSYFGGDELCSSCPGFSFCGFLFYQFPAQVFVGEAPCFITQATIDHIECFVLSYYPLNTVNNVTITVFDQEATLIDALTASFELSPTIDFATEFGPVTGNTSVVIFGSGFPQNSSEVIVTIGLRECHVVDSNETFIECLTQRHPPGIQPIIVATNQGMAVLKSAPESPSLLPHYEYKLVVNIAVFPPVSVFGGSVVELSGSVFVEGETRVIIKGKSAEIVRVESDRLTIRVPSLISTRKVHLLGG